MKSRELQLLRANRRDRAGNVLIVTTIMLLAMCAFISLGVDYGRVQVAKTQLTDAAEVAARYAVTGIVDGTAVTRAQSSAAQNSVDGSALALQSSDVELGTWNITTRAFTATNINPNAVRISARRTSARGNAVALPFGQLIGQSTCDATGTAIAYHNKNIMFVVNNTTLSAADALTRDRLASLGYNVAVTVDSAVTSADAADMRLVVISETCISSNVNTKLTNVAVPVITYEPYLVDDLSLTGAVAGVDYGLTTVGNRVVIDQPSHPCAAGFAGTITITTLPDTTTNGGLAWGVVTGGGLKVASIPGESTHAAIYVWDTGSLLLNGSPAPARRIGFFGSGPLGAFSGGAPATTWTANGWALFDAAVQWALGASPPIRTVRFGS